MEPGLRFQTAEQEFQQRGFSRSGASDDGDPPAGREAGGHIHHTALLGSVGVCVSAGCALDVDGGRRSSRCGCHRTTAHGFLRLVFQQAPHADPRNLKLEPEKNQFGCLLEQFRQSPDHHGHKSERSAGVAGLAHVNDDKNHRNKREQIGNDVGQPQAAVQPDILQECLAPRAQQAREVMPDLLVKMPHLNLRRSPQKILEAGFNPVILLEVMFVHLLHRVASRAGSTARRRRKPPRPRRPAANPGG